MSNTDMKEIAQIRRENLVFLARELGSQKALSDRIGCSESQLNQWINASPNSTTKKPRGISATSVRRIEEKCGKPKGWLDHDHSAHEPRKFDLGENVVPYTPGTERDRQIAEIVQMLKATSDTGVSVALGAIGQISSQYPHKTKQTAS